MSVFDTNQFYCYQLNLSNGDIIYHDNMDTLTSIQNIETVKKETNDFILDQQKNKKELEEINDMIIPRSSRAFGGSLFKIKGKYQSKYL